MTYTYTKRDHTRKKINAAIHSIETSGEKLSISAVAIKAGVSNSLIHNNYGDLADNIRSKLGKDIRAERDKKKNLLSKEREKNRELRREVSGLNSDLERIASINARLMMELAEQKIINQTPNIRKLSVKDPTPN